MERFDAILFDFDGVLADSEPLHWRCWRDALATAGLELSWDYYERVCIGISDREMLEALGRLADPPRTVDELWPVYPLKKEKFRNLVQHERLISDEVIELIKLFRNKPLAVVTSSMESEILPILKRERVFDIFQACVYGDSVKRLKPDPEPYLMAKKLLGVERALVLEDSAAGQASGRAAGCEVIEVRTAADVPGILRGLLAATMGNGQKPQ